MIKRREDFQDDLEGSVDEAFINSLGVSNNFALIKEAKKLEKNQAVQRYKDRQFQNKYNA